MTDEMWRFADDLGPEKRRAAWKAIADLCQRKGVPFPDQLRAALAREGGAPAPGPRSADGQPVVTPR